MARRTKDATGRVTPKGTRPAGSTKTAPSRAGSGGHQPSPAGSGGHQPSRGRQTASSGQRDAAVTPRYAREATGRYTAPIPTEYKSSPWWLPAMMLTFFGFGVLSIVLNYLGVLPASPSNYYLLGGLGLIILGFITSTKWH